jgi:uncharacterized protein (TIGR02231 family)
MKKVFITLSLLAGIFATAQKNSPTFNATLSHANVFYGYGAELTHKAKTSLTQGQQEVTINNVSTSVDEKTLQIGCPENVVLMSYRFNLKTDIVPQTQNPVIKKMEDSIKLMYKQLNTAIQENTVTDELLTKTSKLIETYSASQNKNINGVELIKLIDFYTTKIQGYRTIIYALQLKQNDIREDIGAINARLYEIKNKDGGQMSKSFGQLILQVMTKEATNADFDISYYTQRAGWVPAYDMRVKSIDNSFKLSYKASVSQTTGLDWKQAKLTLSTSNPNQGTLMPTLNPWNLQLYVPQVYNNMLNGKAAGLSANTYNRAQSMTLDEVVVAGYGNQKKRKDIAVVEEKEEVDPSDISSYTTLNESQLYTSFDIDLPYDIPTDGKSISVAIKDENIKATYKHYGIPKLDKDAFLIAEISDWEQLNLLPGEANIIMDNVYLGKSFIDPNTTMDTLNLSLGRDKRIATKRLLMKEYSKTKTKGDTKTETFTYEITVKNNKKDAVNMLLKDQYPLSQVKEVVVKLEEDGGSEVNEELGTLNWKINLKAGESKKYRFSYTVTYPKDKKISNLR